MHGSPLARYSHEHGSGEERLYWGRVAEDGYPFRTHSHNPVLFKEAEYQERAVRVTDFRNGVFDSTVAEDYETECDGRKMLVYGNKRYVAVMERVLNGWYGLVYIDRNFSSDKRLKYLEWTEHYMEDGAPAPAPF